MTAKVTADKDAWGANLSTPATDRTGQTDNERIKDITVLPPPEHLIRFFPIAGTPASSPLPVPRLKK